MKNGEGSFTYHDFFVGSVPPKKGQSWVMTLWFSHGDSSCPFWGCVEKETKGEQQNYFWGSLKATHRTYRPQIMGRFFAHQKCGLPFFQATLPMDFGRSNRGSETSKFIWGVEWRVWVFHWKPQEQEDASFLPAFEGNRCHWTYLLMFSRFQVASQMEQGNAGEKLECASCLGTAPG